MDRLTAMAVFLKWVRSERTANVTRVFVDIRRVTGLDVGSPSERLRFEMSECIAESLPRDGLRPDRLKTAPSPESPTLADSSKKSQNCRG